MMRISASVRVWEVLRGTFEKPFRSIRRTGASEVTNDLVLSRGRGVVLRKSGGLPLRMLLILFEGLSREPPMRLPSDYGGRVGSRAG